MIDEFLKVFRDMSVEDRRDLILLMTDHDVVCDQESVDSIERAIREILEQNPLTVRRMI